MNRRKNESVGVGIMKPKIVFFVTIVVLLIFSTTGCFGDDESNDNENKQTDEISGEKYTDGIFDVKYDFIDITEVIVDIDDTNIYIKITLNNLPSTLTINQEGVKSDVAEYSWNAEFDVDDDNEMDYSMSIVYFSDGGDERTSSILDFQQTLWKSKGNSSWSFLADIDWSIDGNSLVLDLKKASTPELKEITMESNMIFSTSYVDGDNNNHVDELIP